MGLFGGWLEGRDVTVIGFLGGVVRGNDKF